MNETNIPQILDQFEQQSFLDATMIASGHRTVAGIIQSMPQIKTLLEQRSVSVPLITSRYRERDTKLPDHARLVYFVLFGALNLREMSRDISAYLRRSNRVPHSMIASPWHPFLHGIHAMESFTGGQIQAPKSNALMKDFERFLDDVAQWELNHKQPGATPRRD